MVQENKPTFRRTAITEIMCALDSDGVPEADLRTHDQPGAIVEVQDTAAQLLEQAFPTEEPDFKEAEQMPAGLMSEEARVSHFFEGPAQRVETRRFWQKKKRHYSTYCLCSPLVFPTAS